jgi:hypothetical protein
MHHLNIDPAEVKRIMGVPMGASVKPALDKAIEAAMQKCSELLKPRIASRKIAFKKVDHDTIVLEHGVRIKGLKLVDGLKDSIHVVFFIVTTGQWLEQHITTLSAAGKPVDAFIYDAIGSVAAEGLAESFQKEQDEQLRKEGLTTTLRFSPGYCDWAIEEQRMIFELLKEDTAGVTLTPSCIMLPRKSVSGVFGIVQYSDEAQKAKDLHNPCRSCSMKNCNSRRK